MSDERKITCPACGSGDLNEGLVTAYIPMGRAAVSYRDKDAHYFTPGKPLSARKCNQCGHVQLYVAKP